MVIFRRSFFLKRKKTKRKTLLINRTVFQAVFSTEVFLISHMKTEGSKKRLSDCNNILMAQRELGNSNLRQSGGRMIHGNVLDEFQVAGTDGL